MSTITFPVVQVVGIAQAPLLSGAEHLEVSLMLSEQGQRAVLRELGRTVVAETLCKWIEEDLHMEIAE